MHKILELLDKEILEEVNDVEQRGYFLEGIARVRKLNDLLSLRHHLSKFAMEKRAHEVTPGGAFTQPPKEY